MFTSALLFLRVRELAHDRPVIFHILKVFASLFTKKEWVSGQSPEKLKK